MAHVHIAWWTPRTHRLLTTTHNTHKKHKTTHHGPPKPPASRGLNLTGECDLHTLRDRSQSLQHGDVLFNDDTIFSFIYFTAILCAAAQHAH